MIKHFSISIHICALYRVLVRLHSYGSSYESYESSDNKYFEIKLNIWKEWN